MSSVEDFNNFYLKNINVYETADGLIPEIAERLGIQLGDEPNSDDLYQLVGAIGTNKVLRDNEEITAIDRATMVALVDRSAVQEEMNRSLWTPDIRISTQLLPHALIATGAMANWQDRTGKLLGEGVGVDNIPIHIAAGNRVMNEPPEVDNKNIKTAHIWLDRYPTEAEYAKKVIATNLVDAAGGDQQDPEASGIFVSTFDTGVGEKIAKQFFEGHEHLLECRLEFYRVANAGVQLAVQMRKAARGLKSDFDADPANPQVFIATDSFPLAKSALQEQVPAHYQKAQNALRQVVQTAKSLHEAAGGE